MKKQLILLVGALLLQSILFAQELKYNKDVYPSIKGQKWDEAFNLLEKYLTQDPNHVNANYWLGKISESKAESNKDVALINLAIHAYSICNSTVSSLEMTVILSGRYPDAAGINEDERLVNFKKFLSEKIKNLENKKLDFEIYQNKKGEELAKIKQLENDRLNKIKNDSIAEIERIKKEEKVKNQIKYKELNTGINDPLIVAKKYAEAYISGDIETLIKLGYVDETTQKVGVLKQKTLDAYKADKSKFTPQIWKSEVLKMMINPRISKDFNAADYKKANVCGTNDTSFDDLKKPIISVWYENENDATIINIISFDYKDEYCKYLPNDKHEAGLVIKHRTMSLVKKNGKWLVKDLH